MISILITITVCALGFAAYIYVSHDKIAQRKAESYLAKWKVKEERIRTTSNVESVLMTPLQSLTDIVRSISVEQNNTTYESGEAPLVP